MENYIQKLIIVKDLENLTGFAKRHSEIDKLNSIKNEAFNNNGIKSNIYTSICSKLHTLYNEDEDYENARINAMNIVQGTDDSTDTDIKNIAQINLAEAYINEHNIFEANKIFNNLSVDSKNQYYCNYLLISAKLARLNKENKNEMTLTRDSYNYSIKNNNEIETQINILCSLCLCYERQKMYSKAQQGYLELANQIAQNNFQISIEQQLSLEIRIARLAAIEKNYSLSLEILTTINTISHRVLRDNHPLIDFVDSLIVKIKSQYSKSKI